MANHIIHARDYTKSALVAPAPRTTLEKAKEKTAKLTKPVVAYMINRVDPGTYSHVLSEAVQPLGP